MESVIADEKKKFYRLFQRIARIHGSSIPISNLTQLSTSNQYFLVAKIFTNGRRALIHQKVRRVSNSPVWTGAKNGIFVHFIFFTLKFYSSPQLFAFNSSIKDHFHGFKWKFDEKRFYGLFKWSEVIPYEIIENLTPNFFFLHLSIFSFQ